MNNISDHLSALPDQDGTQPRLLVVGAFPPNDAFIFGGIVTVCRALLTTSFRDEFHLILIDSTQISNPPPGILRRGLLAAQRFIRFCIALVRQRPDGVLLFAAVGLSLIEKGTMAVVARAAGIPVALFPRGGAVIDIVRNDARFSRLYSIALKAGDRFLCQGSQWQQFATKELGYRPEHAPVIANWTATSELLSIGSRRMTRKPPPLQLLFVGWLEKEKGVGELLAAVARLRNRFDFTLIIAGDGHFAYDARQLVRENDLDARVSFKGWIEPNNIPSILANSDIFVLPSYAEGLPNAMIEAMATGLPVIVTTVGTVPHVITHRVNGLLVPPHDVDALESAIAALLADEALRDLLGRQAHDTAARLFSVEPAMHKLTSVLKVMIQEHQRTPHQR